MLGAMEARRGHLIPSNCGDRLVTAMWVLRIEPGPLEKQSVLLGTELVLQPHRLSEFESNSKDQNSHETEKWAPLQVVKPEKQAPLQVVKHP